MEGGAWVVYTHGGHSEETPYADHRALVEGYQPKAEAIGWEYLYLEPGDEVEVELAGRKYLLRHEAEG